MKQFSIGIVGAGLITQNTHLPVLVNMTNARIDWVTDADNERARQLATAYSVPFIPLPNSPTELPACDVVLLAIPLIPRRPYYEQLAERGIAVLAEKPFAINSRDHSRFQGLYAAHKIGCGYMRRTYSTIQMFRKIVDESWFGPLCSIHIREGARITRTGVDSSYQDLDIREGGGILVNLGCHSLDTALFVTGAKDFVVNGKEIVFDGNTDRKASGSISLKNLGGHANSTCQFDFCLSWLDSQPNTVELGFETLILRSPIAPSGIIDIVDRGSGTVKARLDATVNRGATTFNQAFYLEWKMFLQGLEDGHPSMISAASAGSTAQLIDELLGIPI